MILTYLDKNIVEEAKDDETFENFHYLQHRAVIRKPTYMWFLTHQPSYLNNHL